jgi:vacuolar protein sorting-associated protein VTA1
MLIQWCRIIVCPACDANQGNYWAVQYAITLGVKDANANVFIASLLDSLEKAKAQMAGNEAITDDLVGKAHMENFAGNIFTKADDEERAKKATKATAIKFLAAAHFMEVIKCFGDLDEEVSLY